MLDVSDFVNDIVKLKKWCTIAHIYIMAATNGSKCYYFKLWFSDL